jgi:uncharacterized membrane protein YoaK (UPF0700 family)
VPALAYRSSLLINTKYILRIMSVEEKSIFHHMTYEQALMCLTFVGGFVDSAGYELLYELFTASITGNIVGATIPLWRIEPGVGPRAVVVMCLGLGAGCVTMYSMKLRFGTTLNKWEVGLRLFACELAALFVSLIVGVSLKYPKLDSNAVFVQAALMAFSMGVQNGAAMVLIPNCPPTTAMTGNTVRFYIYGAEAINFWLAARNYVDLYPTTTGKPEGYDEKMQKLSQELTQKFRIFLLSLASFTVGAVFGIPFASNMGMGCLVVPILIVMWMLYCIWKGLQAQRVEEVARNGGKLPEIALSPMHEAHQTVAVVESVDVVRAETGAAGCRSRSNTARTGAGSERDEDDEGSLSRVGSYQLIEDTYDMGVREGRMRRLSSVSGSDAGQW